MAKLAAPKAERVAWARVEPAEGVAVPAAGVEDKLAGSPRQERPPSHEPAAVALPRRQARGLQRPRRPLAPPRRRPVAGAVGAWVAGAGGEWAVVEVAAAGVVEEGVGAWVEAEAEADVVVAAVAGGAVVVVEEVAAAVAVAEEE